MYAVVKNTKNIEADRKHDDILQAGEEV